MKSELTPLENQELLREIRSNVESKYANGLAKLEVRHAEILHQEAEANMAGDREKTDALMLKRRQVDKNIGELYSQRFQESEKFAREWKQSRGKHGNRSRF